MVANYIECKVGVYYTVCNQSDDKTKKSWIVCYATEVCAIQKNRFLYSSSLVFFTPAIGKSEFAVFDK